MSEHTKSVAIDLDGVLATYDGWKGADHIGKPIDGARAFLKELKRTCSHRKRSDMLGVGRRENLLIQLIISGDLIC